MMEVKKSEYLHMKMECKNGGDKKEIYTYEKLYSPLYPVGQLPLCSRTDRNEAIRIADNFMFSNRQNILSGSLHPEAWFGCLLMQSASVCPSNSEYMDEEGVIYSKDSTTLVYYPSNKMDSVYIMPQSVNHLRSYAFCETYFLRDIQFSENLKEIPRYAFYHCPQIHAVKLPESVKKITPRAFVSCKKLSSVHFPSKLQNIGDDVLFQCGGK